jgi:hypothetical protein
MHSSHPVVPVSVLRAVLSEAVARAGAHSVAREIGISTRPLLDFVEGKGAPRATSLRKYTMWYLRYRRRLGGEIDSRTAAAASDLLVEHLPPQKRPEAKVAFLKSLEKITVDSGVDVPTWMLDGLKKKG